MHGNGPHGTIVAALNVVGKRTSHIISARDHGAAEPLHPLGLLGNGAAGAFKAIMNADFRGQLGPEGVDRLDLERPPLGHAIDDLPQGKMRLLRPGNVAKRGNQSRHGDAGSQGIEDYQNRRHDCHAQSHQGGS